MTTINRKDLVNSISEKVNMTKKDTEIIIRALCDEITENLSSGNTISLSDFGKFEVSTRSAREGHNPKTKEKINIPESKSCKFKVSKTLKDAVNA